MSALPSSLPRHPSEYRILIVDDEAGIREMLSEILEEFDVRLATDGSEVPPLLTSFQPHVIITDLMMPRESGLTVVRRVKADFPGIEVLVITGQGRIEDAVEAMKLGAGDFILKPFNIEQILIAVRKSIDRIEMRQSNRELLEANRELARLAELKEKFLRMTSHELRGPLTVLQGYCDLFPMLVDLPNEFLPASEAMKTAVDNLVSIVENVTLLLTLRNDRVALSPRALDLSALVRQMAGEIGYFARHRGHVIDTAVPEAFPVVGDPLRIRQILRELLLNAVKFTPDGGRVGIEARSAAEPGWFELVVKDSGIGVESEQLANIFEAFYETQNTQHHSTSRTNFKGGGLGIGLNLVQEIIRAYGGRFGFSSEPGQGSTAVVTLPDLVVQGDTRTN